MQTNQGKIHIDFKPVLFLIAVILLLFCISLVSSWDFMNYDGWDALNYRLLKTNCKNFFIGLVFFALSLRFHQSLMAFSMKYHHLLMGCAAVLLLGTFYFTPELYLTLYEGFDTPVHPVKRRWIYLWGYPIYSAPWAILLLLPSFFHLTRQHELSLGRASFFSTRQEFSFKRTGFVLALLLFLLSCQPDPPMLLLLYLLTAFVLLRVHRVGWKRRLVIVGVLTALFVVIVCMGGGWKVAGFLDPRGYHYDSLLTSSYSFSEINAFILKQVSEGGIAGIGLGHYETPSTYNAKYIVSRYLPVVIAREFGLIGLLSLIALFGSIFFLLTRSVRKLAHGDARTTAWILLFLLAIPVVLGFLRYFGAFLPRAFVPLGLPSYTLPVIGQGTDEFWAWMIALGLLAGLTNRTKLPRI